MASTTTNLGLTKPAYTDSADVAVINSNMDILDTKIGAIGNTSVASQIGTLSEQIGAINTALRPSNASWINNANANNYTTTGQFLIGSGGTNFPVEWGILTVIANRQDIILQEYERARIIYIREFRDNAWSNWKAVGKAIGVPLTTLTGDLNDARTPGWYAVSDSCTNLPPERYSGCLLVENGAESTYVRQTYYCGYSNHIYTRTRRYLNGWIWNPWEPILSIKTSGTLTTSGLSSNISSASSTYERNGRDAIIHFTFTSNSQIAVGANVTFTITGLTIYGNSHGCGYSGNTAGIASLANGGSNKINVNVRIIGEPMVNGYSMSCSVPIIVDD